MGANNNLPPTSAESFATHVCRMLKYEPVEDTMPLSTMVGNIKFPRPTVYLMSAGQVILIFYLHIFILGIVHDTRPMHLVHFEYKIRHWWI